MTGKAKNNGKKMIKKHSRWIRISFPADTGKEMTMVSLEKLLLLQRASAGANSWPNKTFSFVPYLKYPKLTPSTLATQSAAVFSATDYFASSFEPTFYNYTDSKT